MNTKKSIVFIGTMLLFMSCATNPFTGKQTLALVPNSQILPMAFQQYNQFLGENKVVTGTKDSEMITRVGQKIATAAERWLNAMATRGILKIIDGNIILLKIKQ